MSKYRTDLPSLTDDEVIEDATWIASNGEGMRSAAERMGTTVAALEARLYRAGAGDVVARLRALDPPWPQSTEQNEARLSKWARSPMGRHVRRDASRWLAHTRGVWPDTEEEQAGRRLVLGDYRMRTLAESIGGGA